MAVDGYLVFTPGTGNAPVTQGESLNTLHPNAVEVKSFTWGVQNAINLGGTAPSRATPLAFTITKAVDSSSVPLFRALVGDLTYSTVTLYFEKAGGPAKDYLIYTFSVVGVSSMRNYYSSGDDTPTEEVVLVFGATALSYAKQNTDGSYNPSGQYGWNFVTNGPG